MMAWIARICSGSLFSSCATLCCASADLWADSVGHGVSERFSGVGYPWTMIRNPSEPSSRLPISMEKARRSWCLFSIASCGAMKGRRSPGSLSSS